MKTNFWRITAARTHELTKGSSQNAKGVIRADDLPMSIKAGNPIMTMESTERKWKEVISSGNDLFSVDFSSLWENRDLLLLLTRRDILAIYKQTILGPLWFLVQPVLTTITFVFIFARGIHLSTSGVPPVLFYMSGVVLWSYFSECITKTSTFLKDNSQILSKVYFPRLILPLSLVLTNLVKFAIQFGVFIVVYLYFLIGKKEVAGNSFLFLLPLLIAVIAGLGLGMGLLIAALTTKYRDLNHLTVFGVQILMFASPVIFPLDSLKGKSYQILVKANPMTGLIEAFRYGFFGAGVLDWNLLLYDLTIVILFLIAGLLFFNMVERSFVDSI